jgi:predicted permease
MPLVPGLRQFFRLPSAERDVLGAVDEELAFHIDMLVEELVAAGATPDEARRAAMRRFGDVERVRDRCRQLATTNQGARRRMSRLADLRQDLGYAARSLRRTPGFTAVVLLTLALGIGATTAIFSVVRGVLLRPLPYPAPEQLVRLWPSNPGAGMERGALSVPELVDWQEHDGALASVAAYSTIGAGLVVGDGEPEYARHVYVSRDFFTTLGTPARLGRTFTAREHEDGRNRVVVVSDAFWRQRLAADAAAVGRPLRIGGEPFTVIGVMPPEFRFPTPESELWVPTSVVPESGVPRIRFARWLSVIGRLRPGATQEQARAELTTLERRLATEYPDSNRGWTSASVQSLRDALVGRVEKGLLVLLGAVALVHAIACANVVNLGLVRAGARARELAVRSAIGAGRTRLVQLLLAESLLLAVVGGGIGVLVAWWGVQGLGALSADFLPRAGEIRVDGAVLGTALIVSLVAGIVVGLLPALRASRAHVPDALRERANSSGRTAQRMRTALVAAEVALAVVLVSGAGLMLRSFEQLTSEDPGFEADHALLARFSMYREPGDTTRGYLRRKDQMVERVRALPGVVAAGATTFAPFTDGAGEPAPFAVPGQPDATAGEEPRVLMQPATPGYLRAMGIPLLAGDDVPETVTDSGGLTQAVISARMARRFWPDRSPVGETFLLVGATTREPVRVVGVAGDVRTARLDSVADYMAYLPQLAMPRVHMSLVIRTAGDPAALIPAVRRAIREIEPNQAILALAPMRDRLGEAAATPRFFTLLVTLFGSLALVLATVGLYGVVSYVVRQREREIGVRVALGATPAEVVRLMLVRSMVPVAIGLAVGLLGAVASTRLLSSLLYEVSPTDPLTLAAVVILLIVAAAIAAYLPARRAAGVDPTVALRSE